MKARKVFISSLFKTDFLRMTMALIPALCNVLAELSYILKSRDSISDKVLSFFPVPTWGSIRYKAIPFHPNHNHFIRINFTLK